MKPYIATFDDGPSGWLSWDGPLKPVRPKIRDGAMISRSPWGVDANHAPPGGGYLHLLFILQTFYPPGFSGIYKQVADTCGTNRFVEGGFSRDLRNAKLRVRLKGEVNLRGSQLVLLAQGNIARDQNGKLDWSKSNTVNQVLTAQPFTITPEWSEQTITLVPDQKQWQQLGGRHDSAYREGPIEELLRDVNYDLIFILFPLDVRPLKPIQDDPHILIAGRDYEIDRSRLPDGYVMVDEVRIEFPGKNALMTTRTQPMKTPPYVEKFDDGPCGWLSWERPGRTVPAVVRDSALISRGPWAVDPNHAPPGGGYLHLLFVLHTFYPPNFPRAIIDACAPNRFIHGGYSRDLRNATIRVRIRGDVTLRGAQPVLLAQSNLSKDWNKPHWVNQVLSSQPLRVTPEWSEQTLHLTTDPSQWTQLGSRHDCVGFYEKGPIEEVLRELNGDIIFVLFPLDVVPLKPIQGDPHILKAGSDYEVDASRLPQGHVMLDEVRIEFP